MKYLKILGIICVILTFLPVSGKGQGVKQVTIESVVLDINGNPVADAAVFGNEGRIVKYTDQSGKFSITVQATSSILVTAKGYKSKTLQVGTGFNNIVLDPDLGERKVNVAFKQVDSKDLVGSVNVVNPTDYLPFNYGRDVVSGLAGQTGGLTGFNNIWGMDGALIMIDGIARSYNDVRMDEIEQVTYLKGVNAVALYGSTAAKGVVLITTKRGEANNRKINVLVNTGISTPKALPSYLGSADYMTYYNQARINDGYPVAYTDATIENYRSGNKYRYPSVDYFSPEYIKKYQYNTDVVTEFTGGNENAKFYSNIGWSTNSSLLKVGQGDNERNSRFNIRANVDIRINKNITSTIDGSLIVGSNKTGLVNVAPISGSAALSNYWAQGTNILPWQYSPLIPMDLISRATSNASALLLAKNSKNIVDGSYIFGGTQQYQTNPFADLLSNSYNTNVSRTFQVSDAVNFDLDNTVKGLSFQTKIFLDFVTSYNQSINNTYSTYTPIWSTVGDSITGFTKYGTDARTGTQNVGATTNANNIGTQLQFNYVRTFNEVHNLAAIVLANYYGINRNGVYQTQTNSNLGLQLAYNYKHKYWFDFSGAYVSSTKLPGSTRTAFSPTASIGWLISDEAFLKDAGFIDQLKISASAGIINEDLEISNYFLYDPTYFSNGQSYGWYDGTYSYQATASRYGASPDLGFAKRKEISLDLEGSFFKRMVTLNASYFTNRIDDLPVQRFNQYPSYLSDFVPYSNYNSDARRGFDMILNIRKKVAAFDYDLGIMASYITSEAIIRDELYGADTYRNRVGKPTDAIFGLVSKGFFTDVSDVTVVQAFGAVKPGDLMYEDQNDDKIINQQDEKMIGRYEAPFNYALNFSVGYRNIKLFVQGIGNSGGHDIKSGSYYWIDGDVKYSSEVINSWTPATASTATYPRLSSITNTNNNQTSTFWLYSTDALRLSKIQLSCNLPRNFFGNSFIREFEIYINGSNLYTLSKSRKILDLTVGNTPQMSYYNIGLSAKF
ncbi:MAG TPA: SusC/RagA family TonB-linked outer membrane protein [Bacteroidales bacterium]|nr:SusC/RagA family TonB-linked outer membrane protein [Bacteroidales bacterium]